MGGRLEIGIDNFRFFYLYSGAYELPGVTSTGITPAQKTELFEVLQKVHPPFTEGFQILPQNRPARYASELHLARPLHYEGADFVFVLRILAEYRGGAESTEILEAGAQDLTPRIRTNKIYYRSKIVPCKEIVVSDGRVLDFVPDRLEEVGQIFTETMDGMDQPGAKRHTFAVFLETDTADYNASQTARFGDWPHENVFYPLVADDYITLSLNALYPHPYYAETVLPPFARAFAAIKAGEEPPEADRAFWGDYFAGIEMERSYSRAGNPHWRLTRFPWDS